jgi:hypothetical protein
MMGMTCAFQLKSAQSERYAQTPVLIRTFMSQHRLGDTPTVQALMGAKWGGFYEDQRDR